MDVHGVSVSGLAETGAEITIMNGETFQKVASVAHLKKKHFKAADKTPNGYDQRPFQLDGKMDLDILFNEKMIHVPVYVKLDAKDYSLLSQGVCRQLGILTYHPAVQPLKRIHQKLRVDSANAQEPIVQVKLVHSVKLVPFHSTVVSVQFP